MSLGRKKKHQFSTVLAVSIILVLVIVLMNDYFRNSSVKHVQPDEGALLIHLRQPGWQGYNKLRNGFEKLHQNWTGSGIKKPTGDTLEQNAYVLSEFDRQIAEIKRISNVEVSLKLSEQNQAFQDFAKKRRHEFDLGFQKKAVAINDALKRELQQKTVETELEIQKNRHDLELEQRLNLVNLQLQISVTDLNVNQAELKEKKSKILAEIADIKLAITKKVVAQKELLQNQLFSFEQARRQQASIELEDLKARLEIDVKQDLTEFQAKLNADFYDWCQNHTSEFTKAIKIRQEQRKK